VLHAVAIGNHALHREHVGHDVVGARVRQVDEVGEHLVDARSLHRERVESRGAADDARLLEALGQIHAGLQHVCARLAVVIDDANRKQERAEFALERALELAGIADADVARHEDAAVTVCLMRLLAERVFERVVLERLQVPEVQSEAHKDDLIVALHLATEIGGFQRVDQQTARAVDAVETCLGSVEKALVRPVVGRVGRACRRARCNAGVRRQEEAVRPIGAQTQFDAVLVLVPHRVAVDLVDRPDGFESFGTLDGRRLGSSLARGQQGGNDSERHGGRSSRGKALRGER